VPPAEAGSSLEDSLQRGAEAPLYPYSTNSKTDLSGWRQGLRPRSPSRFRAGRGAPE